MTLTHPYWLLGLIPLGLYLILAWRRQTKLETRRQTIFFARRRDKAKQRSLLLLMATGTLILLALTEPVIYRLRPVFKRSGIDIAVGIDISKSMLAEDAAFPADVKKQTILTNRLNRARMTALDLLDKLQGEKIGIFVFAAQSYELTPLTTDYGYCRYLVENLDELALATPGSELAAGLESGLEMLERKQPAGNGGIIILITDGEDSEESSPDRLQQVTAATRQKGYRVYTLGVGGRTPSLIPIRTPDGKQVVGYYKDEKGKLLTTTMQAPRLKTLAAAGGGRYWQLGREKLGSEIDRKILTDLQQAGRATVYENLPYSLSSWLLALAFVTFLLTL